MRDAFGVTRPEAVSKKKDRGWGFDSDDARERTGENIKRKGAYVSSKGERRGKNWARLGGHTAVGATTGAILGGSAAANNGRGSSKAVLAGLGVGAGIGGGLGALSGAATNEYRASQDAHDEAVTAGDFREARKGERASEYHQGVIVPKKKYKKAQFKAMRAENTSLKERLGTVNKAYDAFGVEIDTEVAKALSLAPLKPVGDFVKGAASSLGMRRSSPVSPAGVAGAKQGGSVMAGAKKAGAAIAAKPKTSIGVGVGATGIASGTVGYNSGQRRNY